MRNKNVGFLIVGISMILFVIIWIFNRGIIKIISDSCSHGSSCGMYDTLSLQTGLSVAIAGIILIVGLFLIFSKEDKKIIIKKVKERKKKISLEGLNEIEKKAVKIIKEKNGIFQAELVEKLEIGKVGMTRLLDKLEAKGIIERKRRGMNNFIILK